MQIPLMRKAAGRLFGNRTADVQVEVFLDVQCPHSAKAWPTIEQVMAHYGPDGIGLSIYMMVLSNHRQSWDVTLALYGLSGEDDARFFRFLAFLYSHQERYFNGAFAHRTHDDLKQLVENLCQEFDGTPAEQATRLLADDNVFAAAKHPGRVAALRGVWSTPTIFINHSERSELGSSSSLGDWRATIDPFQ